MILSRNLNALFARLIKGIKSVSFRTKAGKLLILFAFEV